MTATEFIAEAERMVKFCQERGLDDRTWVREVEIRKSIVEAQ